MTLGDRVAAMSERRIAQIGTPYAIDHHPDYRFSSPASSARSNTITGEAESGCV